MTQILQIFHLDQVVVQQMHQEYLEDQEVEEDHKMVHHHKHQEEQEYNHHNQEIQELTDLEMMEALDGVHHQHLLT